MNTKPRYKRPLTLDELRAMPDEDIDFSDIPKLDESFWRRAVLAPPPNKKAVSLRLDEFVLDFFKELGPGYQTRINSVLKAYVIRARSAERERQATRARHVAEEGAAFRMKTSRAKKAPVRRKK